MDTGKFAEQLTGDYSRCISTPNEEINIDSQKNRFLIDGVKYVLPKDGIGVMVYDLELGYLVDVALIDVYQDGNVVKHASINM